MPAAAADIMNGLPGEDCLREVFPVLPANLRKIISAVGKDVQKKVEEIRLRTLKPLILGLDSDDVFISEDGAVSKDFRSAYIIKKEDVERCLSLVSGSSIYAFEEEIKNGYITIPGGHRIGLTGKSS